MSTLDAFQAVTASSFWEKETKRLKSIHISIYLWRSYDYILDEKKIERVIYEENQYEKRKSDKMLSKQCLSRQFETEAKSRKTVPLKELICKKLPLKL